MWSVSFDNWKAWKNNEEIVSAGWICREENDTSGLENVEYCFVELKGQNFIASASKIDKGAK